MVFEWKQPELDPADPGVGDAAAQLFEGRRQMRPEIFVREDLQNRVDARRDDCDDPVHVRISFQALPASLIGKYFPDDFQDWYRRTETQTLNEDERERRLRKIDQIFASTEFPVLVIEDFNSTGLNGPVNSSIPEKDPANPLYHPTNALTCFFRRSGLSGKTDKKLGSAGLGRHVYYKASQISSKLIYTIPTDLSREDDGQLNPLAPRPLFFGQSFQRELAVREAGRQRRYCSYHHLSGQLIDRLPMPFGLEEHEAEIVEQVRHDFGLARQPDQPGCSIIIPFPKNNFTPDALINSIVRDFSMPILSGTLVVEIDGLTITADNVSGLSDKPEVNEHNAFLQEAHAVPPETTVTVSEERLKRPLGEDLFAEPVLKQLARSFRDMGMVCVQADIRYGTRKEQAGSVLISARKTDPGRKGRHIVSRSGLVLSKYSDRNFRQSSNAMVMVQADNLGSLLRGIENPAHTEWLAGDVDPHRCSCMQELIQFITHAHHALVRMMVNLDTEDDVNIFSDLVPAGPRRNSEPAMESPFDIEIQGDGQTLTLKAVDDYDAEPGTVWRTIVLYDSVFGSGRARKGYRSGTFDLQTVPVEVLGGRVLDRGECHFDVAIESPDNFCLTFGPCGFAAWADLRFHAERITAELEANA